ncbi:MAG: low molecular weight protein-tyrosine-phosphatase [Eubacteriales bacterium]|nr:low molecular weight protein-tyrosine-phosphatase [Eubacteriales bacterium]
MFRILFICHGNICRSPMAEYIMKELLRQRGLESQFQIDSAATSREEIGSGVYPPARRKLERMGIPCGNHRSVQVTRRDYDEYDYLIIMDRNNYRNLMRILREDPEEKVHTLLSYVGLARDVADPWYTGDFDAAFDDIYTGCTALLEEILGE